MPDRNVSLFDHRAFQHDPYKAGGKQRGNKRKPRAVGGEGDLPSASRVPADEAALTAARKGPNFKAVKRYQPLLFCDFTGEQCVGPICSLHAFAIPPPPSPFRSIPQHAL